MLWSVCKTTHWLLKPFHHSAKTYYIWINTEQTNRLANSLTDFLFKRWIHSEFASLALENWAKLFVFCHIRITYLHMCETWAVSHIKPINSGICGHVGWCILPLSFYLDVIRTYKNCWREHKCGLWAELEKLGRREPLHCFSFPNNCLLLPTFL